MMALSWWRQLVHKRMTRAASRGNQRPLFVEALEDRTTPTGIIAVGSPAGSAAVVTVFSATTRQQLFTVSPFPNFTGGTNVAVGDVNGDGTADVIVGAGPGGGSDVFVYSGVDGSLIGSITVGDASSRAGTTVAAADFDADGKADLVVGTVSGGQPTVEVVRFSDQKVLHTFAPFGAGSNAPSVAAGDFNGDGTPDVVTGAPVGDGPQVLVFDGSTEATLFNQYAFEQSFTGGVQVAAGDLDGDGKAEVVAAAGTTGGPRVVVFSGGTGAVYINMFAYNQAGRAGVGAAVADSNQDSALDLITADGAGTANSLEAFDGKTANALPTPTFTGLPAAAVYDTTAPTATLVSTSPAAANQSSFPFTATFSEPVNGFSASGLALTNATASNFARVDAKTYTFDLNPTTPNTASTVQVTAGAAGDAAGNPNTASNTLTRTDDTVGPVLTINQTTTNKTTPTITGTVDEAGSTVSVTAAGQTVAATVTGTTWSATLPTAVADGTYDVTATGTDAGGTAGKTVTLTGGLVVDTVPPTVTLDSAAPTGTPTKTSPIPYTVVFTENVTGFTATSPTVVNGAVTNFVKTDGEHYSFGIIPTAQGAVSVTIAAGAATDAAGNGNTASSTVTRTFDSIAPAVTANTLTTNDTTPELSGTIDDNGATIQVTVSGNGQPSQTVTATQTGGTWSATPTTALPEGTYSIAVSATDAAGNVGVANQSGGLVIDTTPPTVTSITGPTSPTNASPVDLTVTFGEPVTGFGTSGVSVSGGAATSVTPVGSSTTQYTVAVTPSGDGPLSVFVTAGAAHDTAGNANTQSSTFNITSDRTDPVVAADALTTNDQTPTLTGTVDDASTTTVRVAVGGQTVTATVTGKNWAAAVPTALDPGTYDIAATATDAAGNVGTKTVTGGLVIDTTPPTASVDPTGTGAVTGTASDSGSGVKSVGVAVQDPGTGDWYDGSGFTLSSPDYRPATDTSGSGTFATWSFAFPKGTYNVSAQATDVAGNVFTTSTSPPQSVTVS